MLLRAARRGACGTVISRFNDPEEWGLEVSMRVTSRLCLSLIVAFPLAAYAVPAPAPCTIHPADSSAENGFGPGAGEFPRTFCSLMDVPVSDNGLNCLWGDYYYVDEVGAAFTSTSAEPISLVHIEADANFVGLPGASLDGLPPAPGTVPSPPAFPAQEDLSFPRYTFYGRYFQGTAHSHTDEPNFWGCTHQDDGVARGYITVDHTLATPINPCYTGINGGPITDPCTDGDSNLRAIGITASVSPIGGLGNGAQVEPPTPSSAHARLQAWYTSTPTFTFRIYHDVASPTAAHIHVGRPGENGPVVIDLGTPTSPILVSNVSLTGQQLVDLSQNNLYFDIESALYPDGEVRGQIFPAQPPVFEDGFESGDTVAWSDTVP